MGCDRMGRIEIRAYISPEAYQNLEDSRNKNVPKATYVSMILEELFESKTVSV